MTNFKFLKDIDNDLYKIAYEAEKLYRDEYFDQCITQTRKFGENICKKVLKNNRRPDDSFDEMLATLKDMSHGSAREKEFIEDLYFLKRNGNISVHSNTTSNSGIKALECLQRAFEAAVNFATTTPDYNPKIENLVYDEELLITGKKSRSKTLQEKYLEEKKKELKKSTAPAKKKQTAQTRTTTKKPASKRQYSVTKKQNGKKFSIFKILLTVSSIIAFITLMVILAI